MKIIFTIVFAASLLAGGCASDNVQDNSSERLRLLLDLNEQIEAIQARQTQDAQQVPESPAKPVKPNNKIASWKGVYVATGKNVTAFGIDEKKFTFAVPVEGRLQVNVRMEPHKIVRITDRELVVTGVDLKSATHETATYKLTRSGSTVTLEKTNGIFAGPLGKFKKR